MRNSWLDKYTSESAGNPRFVVNVVIGFLATAAIGTLLAGSMWIRMEDSQNALAEISSSHTRELRQSMKSKATSLLAMASPKTEIAVAETVSAEEEVLAMQSISDLEAVNDGSKMDPFSPLVTSDSASSGVDPTKPKDVLDDVQFTGFINDAKAKDKVAIIRVGPVGSTKSLIKKIGESFYSEDQKITVKDIKSGTLYLSIGGARRTLQLTPYIDAGGGGSSASGGGSVTTPTTSSASGSSNKSLNLEEL